MKSQTPLPDQTELPASVAPQSLADLSAFVANHPDLSPTQRRDMTSAITSLAAYLGSVATALPADGRRLRHRIDRLHHEQLGVTKKRLDNVIGGTKRALKLASAQFPGARRRAGLEAAWAPLRDALPPKSKYVYHLGSFIAFCSDRAVAPDAVDDDTLAAFLEHLENNSLRKDPRRAYRNACKWWNQAVTNIPDWPQQSVSVPSFKASPKTIPLDAFPDSFAADLEACQAVLLTPNPFRGKTKRRRRDGKRRHTRTAAYAPATAQQWRAMLHRAASVLVDAGICPLSDVTEIAVLCEADAAERILSHYWAEAGEQATAYTALLAKVLAIVAEVYLDADEQQLDDLWANVADMTPDSEGLTQKNRDRLKLLSSDDNKRLLLNVPIELCRDPNSDKPRCKAIARKQDAVDLMVAAAVAILLHAPVRLKNLTRISLEYHLTRNADGSAALYVPAGDVKNGVALDFLLPTEAMDILDDYLAHARCWWLGPNDDRLFPFGDTRPSQAHFGDLLTQRVRRVTGLRVNTHLFRHIAAKLYLDEYPGQYEVIRLQLGHKSLSTTIQFYCGLEREAAVNQFTNTVVEKRAELNAESRAVKHRRRRGRRRATKQRGAAK
jgi:integrase